MKTTKQNSNLNGGDKMTNMEAQVIAVAIKDGQIELSGWSNKTEQKTIKKLAKQGWLVGLEQGSFMCHGRKVYKRFKFDLEKAYYNFTH
jgi:hypothetical protein